MERKLQTLTLKTHLFQRYQLSSAQISGSKIATRISQLAAKYIARRLLLSPHL